MNCLPKCEYREAYHGQYLALSVEDAHAVFPCLFHLHMLRAAARFPFTFRPPPPPEARFWPQWIEDKFLKDGKVVHWSSEELRLKRARGDFGPLEPEVNHSTTSLDSSNQSEIALPTSNTLPQNVAGTSSGSHSTGGLVPNTRAPGFQVPNMFEMVASVTGMNVQAMLDATRNSSTWVECVREGGDWSGTADDNIAKFMAHRGPSSRQE